jgi:hypothetical protein
MPTVRSLARWLIVFVLTLQFAGFAVPSHAIVLYGSCLLSAPTNNQWFQIAESELAYVQVDSYNHFVQFSEATPYANYTVTYLMSVGETTTQQIMASHNGFYVSVAADMNGFWIHYAPGSPSGLHGYNDFPVGDYTANAHAALSFLFGGITPFSTDDFHYFTVGPG